MTRIFLTILLALVALAARAFTTETFSLPGPQLDYAPQVTVVLPSDTTDARRFPVVYLLHGYEGDNTNFVKLTPDAMPLADSLGVIIVTPEARDTWYWDSPLRTSSRMESWMVETLVPAIDNRYPTIPDAGHRAVTGLSMGGNGALRLAFHHPEVWAQAGAMSAAVDMSAFPKSCNVATHLGPWSRDNKRWRDFFFLYEVRGIDPTKAPRIFIDCGTEDFLFRANEELHHQLSKLGIQHAYTTRPGKHDWNFWRQSVPLHLKFFSQGWQD